MPEAELSLLFIRPLNLIRVRYIESLLNQAKLLEWIHRRGLEPQWELARIP